ncbi:MAG: helix-turn-helix transcriptional regulator [Deltaproteobacteria bacterium]|nr:helix-turn-helix transcriptional regulator [Deltaproteobacteria bacterium]
MKNSIITTFGLRVHELRLKKGYSQEELADHCNLHRTFIGRIERGETNVTLINIYKIAHGLTVPAAALLDKVKRTKRALDISGVLNNIRDPRHWIQTEALIQVIIDNPSLRGIIYGYVSEVALLSILDKMEITEHFKPDDHKKTKSDRTFIYNGRQYTLQLKSMQTSSIKEVTHGKFIAKVQNDASDRRKIKLPNGETLETTCYLAGEYDILGVSLQPFTGEWRFAFKKNKDLKRSTYRKYSPEAQKMLLATLEDIAYPLTPDWTENLLSLLDDPDLGKKNL